MTREWARTGTGGQRILTTYKYGFQDGTGTNGVGDLIGVAYTYDPASTPSLSYVYDRLGRRITATQGGMTTTLSYDDASDFLGESYSGGVLDGFSVSSGYDSIDRRTSLTASGSSALLTNTFGYDSASELTSVSYGPFSANYSYVANSPLVGQIVCQSNSTVQLTTTKQYDNLDRLWSIVSTPGASGQWPISYVYQYNQANQRTQASQYDNSFWKYDYDALGQVISGEKHWSDNTHVPGEQFQYAFDDIGNRTSTESGGDQNGNNLRSATYSVNNLNQYTSRTVPNGFDMLGQVNVGATVWVNGSVSDYRRGEFFQKGLTVTNSSQAVWLPVTVGASNGATTNFVAGHEFVVETPENYTYDADGNLTQDGRWNYTWDAENRLIEMASLSGAPSGSQYKLDFSYDYQGRRIQKLVSTNNGSWVPFYTNRFLYDGWNPIAILNPDNSMAESLMWGNDLSGSMHGAGGVGGLLAVKVSSGENAGTYFYAFDGNGNVAGLVSAGNGTTSAEYEYGPFGELLRATGPIAFTNPFRFSTKYQDDETQLIVYGHRFYSSTDGRWLSRDPIEEKGGVNLYGYAANDPINSIDLNGLSQIEIRFKDGTTETIWFPSYAKLRKVMNNAIQSGNLIDELVIKGHGSKDSIYLRGGGKLGYALGYSQSFEVKGVNIMDDNEESWTPLFSKALTPTAIVILNGCNTGYDANSIAGKMSIALPHRMVGGGAWYHLSCPWTSCTFGSTTFYLDGTAIYNDWYW